MNEISFYASAAAFAVVILTWIVFAVTFTLKKIPKSVGAPADAKRAPKSLFGIVLQGLSFALVWALHRTPFLSPFIGDGQYALNVVLQILAVALVCVSVWLATSAVRELDKQWSLTARLIENHQLITSGVYRFVRHPIYAAMFGMMVATAIVLSHWLVLTGAAIVFLIGTKIRTSSEERLLREAFPAEYKEYAARVPALIPFVKI